MRFREFSSQSQSLSHVSAISCFDYDADPRPLYSTRRVLGGGGGKEGFRKHRAQLGAAAEEWLADMRKHAWKEDPDAEAALAASVDEELAALGDEKVKGLAAERDHFVLETLKLKQKIARESA